VKGGRVGRPRPDDRRYAQEEVKGEAEEIYKRHRARRSLLANGRLEEAKAQGVELHPTPSAGDQLPPQGVH
jgi:hypothetical protein